MHTIRATSRFVNSLWCKVFETETQATHAASSDQHLLSYSRLRETLSHGSSPKNVVHLNVASISASNSNLEEWSFSSDYIRSGGKHILPRAFIKETWNGCHVPYKLNAYRNSENVIDIRISYLDNTYYPYLPVSNIRLLTNTTLIGVADGEEWHGKASIEMSGIIYENIMDLAKKAYIEMPNERCKFISDTPRLCPERRVEMKIPIMTGCFAHVGDKESSLKEVLGRDEMFQRDIAGGGLLKVQFREEVEGTRIMLLLAGIVVERDPLNEGEKIFELFG